MFVRDFTDYYTLPTFPNQTVVLESGQTINDINFHPTAVAEMGSISGRVTDNTGTGIENAQVHAISEAGIISPTTQTSANGDYTITNLFPTTYRVMVRAAGFQDPASLVVTVQTGQNRDNTNFQLNPETRSPSISGRVTDGITGIQGVLVTATTGGTAVPPVLTNGNGQYSFVNLTPRQYSVAVTVLNFASPAAQSVSVTATATAPATANFTLTAAVAGSISGRVTRYESSSKTGGAISPTVGVGGVDVRAIAVTGGTSMTVQTDSTGNYQINNLTPGVYRVSVDPSTVPASVLRDRHDIEINGHHYIVLGYFYDAANCGVDYSARIRCGPEMRTHGFWHSWDSAATTSERLVGVPVTSLSVAQLSTLKVVLPSVKTECEQQFDLCNAFDDSTMSIPLFHWTMGNPPRPSPTAVIKGELLGFLAYLRHVDQPLFTKAIGNFGIRALNNWDDGTSSAVSTHPVQAKFVDQVAHRRAGSAGFVFVPDQTSRDYTYFRSWHWFYRFVMTGRTFGQ
jgi:hypothetical protein